MEINRQHLTGALVMLLITIAFVGYTYFVWKVATDSKPFKIEPVVVTNERVIEKLVDTSITITRTDAGDIIVHPIGETK
jgi:cell division septal protein FtsQ